MRSRLGGGIVLAALGMLSTFPILWLLLTALKDRQTIIQSPPQITFHPSVANVSATYYGESVVRLVTNSLTVSVTTALLTVLIGVPAGFFFARRHNALANHAFLFVLSTRIISPVALSLPYVVIFSQASLRGSKAAVVLCHIAFSVSIVVWLAERFFSRLDRSVETAAMLDGASEGQTFLRVVLPQSVPVIAVCLLLALIFSWNEFMIASILAGGGNRLITTALPLFVTQGITQWGRFAVLAIVSIVPVMLSVVGLLGAASRISPAFLLSTKR